MSTNGVKPPKVGILHPRTLGATKESYPLFRCPKCRQTGFIDEDQFHGRVSIVCDHCDYHETNNWSQR